MDEPDDGQTVGTLQTQIQERVNLLRERELQYDRIEKERELALQRQKLRRQLEDLDQQVEDQEDENQEEERRVQQINEDRDGDFVQDSQGEPRTTQLHLSPMAETHAIAGLQVVNCSETVTTMVYDWSIVGMSWYAVLVQRCGHSDD
jgi:hypothetical protein